MPQRELLKALKEQLAFVESGGYGNAYRSAWRPTLVIRDSPLCLNATSPQARPCRECILYSLVPVEMRNSLLPCHHIPLNEAGDTIAQLYATGTQKELDQKLHDWLWNTILRLEEREATAMETLECTTAISFKNILFLTDFTSASKAAFTYAVALARHFNARLYPAHAVVPYLPTELEAPVAPDVLASIEAEKRAILVELVKTAGVANTPLITQQDLEDAVPHWINEHGIDLIVMGTHGRTGVDRIFLGSTAETIVRLAKCPVLTVGPQVIDAPGNLKISKVLFATSLTKETDPAASYALSFAQEENANLTVLHVLPAPAETQEDWKTLADIARSEMKELAPFEQGPTKTEFLVEPGDPTRVILDYAKKLQPELIVLGLAETTKTSTHFRRGVAYKVISSAPCAVLTVRKPF